MTSCSIYWSEVEDFCKTGNSCGRQGERSKGTAFYEAMRHWRLLPSSLNKRLLTGAAVYRKRLLTNQNRAQRCPIAVCLFDRSDRILHQFSQS